MTIEIEAEHRLGAFRLEAAFASGPGVTALFGRSGAGKTTLVNVIAGLLRPARGRLAVEGALLLDTARGIFVPAHKRRIGYVFQEGRLFPHLTVRQNLLFGRWFHRKAAHPTMAEVVALLDLAPLVDRRPAALSGGEKQRVAIGRALLADPRLLLMDEPLASLDAERKSEILPYIERLRDETKIPIVYVSHSIPEVTRLATTLVLMAAGRVEAVGTVEEVMGRLDLAPKTGRFEAGAVLEARVASHDATYGLTQLRCAAGELTVPRLALPLGTAVRVRIRARDVIIAREPPRAISALNVLRGRVAEIAAGDAAQCEIRLALGSASLLARITRRSLAELDLAPGSEVFAVVKSVALGDGPETVEI
ncbi:MAG TPA: molybdenum ABC transporter ATP-binding protein [Stellaceae bacterium]|nr:molybdenum ABC transporter ATP-binding protein [Stellaceae bacterium]